MRILQINSTVNTGSTGRIAENIGRQLIDAGHRSTIAYGKAKNSCASETIRIGNVWDHRWHGLMTRLFDRHGLASKSATKVFLKQLEQQPPDVIGLHNIHGYYLHYPTIFAFIKKNNIPVIWTLHDCWSFTGHCAYFDRAACRKWQTHCKNCPLTYYYPKSLTDRSYQNFEDKKTAFTGVNNLQIVTPSHWLENHVNKSFLKDYPTHVIHNGVDLSVFNIKTSHDNGAKLVLGVASPWSERKGLQDFFDLREQLSKDWQIHLIGLSKDQLNNLPKGITGINRTENTTQLVEFYNLASVFVNPTYVDNFPTTNLEALACGTPVITYNTGGSPEAIDDNTGKLVKKGDIRGLADSIIMLGQQDQQALAIACRQRAEKYFNQEDRYREYVKLYEQLYTIS